MSNSIIELVDGFLRLGFDHDIALKAAEKERERQVQRQESKREIERQREIDGRVPPDDVTDAVAKKICIPFEENVLGDINLLINALKSPLLATIPVGLRHIPSGSGLTLKAVFEESDKYEAVFLVDSFRGFEMRSKNIGVNSTEQTVSACITSITGMMWQELATCVNLRQCFTFCYDTVNGRRPYETDYLNDFLVSKSEHRRDNIQDAISELKTKLSQYNHVDYGQKIVHLPVISAAANFVEFGVIDVRTKLYKYVDRFDLCGADGKALCFVRAINFFRLFLTMAPHIPNYIPTPQFLCGDD